MRLGGKGEYLKETFPKQTKVNWVLSSYGKSTCDQEFPEI